jgi:hypothetical protein
MADAGIATVIIGDIVGSRGLRDRGLSQSHLKDLIATLNRRFRKSILTKFAITVGDEFEAVLRDPTIIPDVIWEIRTSFNDAPIRLSFGAGTIATGIDRNSPREMDGQAFHQARRALLRARKENLLGGVFLGYGDETDRILNGFSRILEHHWRGLTRRQREVLAQRRAGVSQVDIAAASGVTESAISQTSRKSGWQAFSEAENGFRASLRSLVRHEHRA